MSKIIKIQELSTLFDVYKNLLTDNQREVFISYYLEDESLAEIADRLSISRASVSDNLKKTEDKLLRFEMKLSLAKKNQRLNKIIDELEDDQLVKKLKKIID